MVRVLLHLSKKLLGLKPVLAHSGLSFHVLPVSLWLFSRHLSFPPKDMHISMDGYSELLLGVSEWCETCPVMTGGIGSISALNRCKLTDDE